MIQPNNWEEKYITKRGKRRKTKIEMMRECGRKSHMVIGGGGTREESTSSASASGGSTLRSAKTTSFVAVW